MEIFFGVLIGIFVLTVLVVIHELGHALVAKRNGVIVEEFGVGFPPKAWSKKVKKSILGNDVVYSINWLPLGGFVKLKGENDSASEKGDYGSVSFWQKTQILLAGVFMNWIGAAVILTVLAVFGVPKMVNNQFVVPSDSTVVKKPVELVSVSEGMPASKAGLERGDKILKFDNHEVNRAEDLTNLAKQSHGKTVPIVYQRGGEERQTVVAIRDNNDDKKGYLGVVPTQQVFYRATWSAPIVGVGLTTQLTKLTFEGLGKMLSDTASGLYMKVFGSHSEKAEANEKLSAVGDNVAGPLGIFGVIFPAAERAGLTYVLLLAAIISLTLAVMNVLPIPALDGGRWFVTALFKLLRKPLNKELEEKIHGTGFMLLMVLVIAVTIADIGKFR